jgi:two-component system, cell cycle sensor histidine kinase and response regulator CckA
MRSDLIMVVDDEEDLRHLYVDALKMRGFKVQAYSNTREALDEIRDDPRKYRLVISDDMMKQMNGPIFADKIKEINRDMKVILISGFDYKTMDLSHGRYDKFVQIPVTLWEFFSAVNEVLEMPLHVESNRVT